MARSYFGEGFLRGLNSVVEVFAPYAGDYEYEEEQAHRFEDARRGKYLGWSLTIGAVIAAAVVDLRHGPWQVSVALAGIPVLGAVQALVTGGRRKHGQSAGSDR